MYKILLILLFGFIIAEENPESHIVHSDSLDMIWAWEELDETMIYCINRISDIIDPDKFDMVYYYTLIFITCQASNG